MSALCQEGRYLAQITAQYFGKSPEKGTPSFNFGIRILKNLDQPEAPSEPLVRELTWWIAEKTSKWVLSDLQKLGYPGKTLVGLDPQTPGFHNFVGQEIEVFCAHENYKDKPRERWSVRMGRQDPLDTSEIRALDRMMAAQTKAANGAPVVPQDPMEITDADVPF